MITREEVLEVLRKKEKTLALRRKNTLANALERISKGLRLGKFYFPNIGSDAKLQEGIKKALAREGLDITFKSTMITNRKSPKKSNALHQPYQVTNAIVSLKED